MQTMQRNRVDPDIGLPRARHDREESGSCWRLRHALGDVALRCVARWAAAITGLAPPFLRELAERLKELDAITKETSRQLRVTLRPAVDGRTSTDPVLDHALASLERLDEIAGAMMRRLDALLKV